MKVAIYTRVSTREKQTTENQELQLKEFCVRSKYNIYNIYTDIISGKET